LWALIVLLALGLAYFAFLGSYNRYYSDDWCYFADVKELGLSQSLAGYTSNVVYSSSRFSLTLFSALIFPLGITGLKLMTMFGLIFFSLGVQHVFSQFADLFSIKIDKKIVIAGSFLIAFFSIYIAPIRYQSFYWLTGFLPYTLPLIIAIWIAAIILKAGNTEKPALYTRPLLGALAFFGAGFSEAGAAFLLTIIIFLLATVFLFRNEHKWATRMLIPSLWALAFATLSVTILLLSPASWERVSRYGEMAGAFEFIQLTLKYSWDFVRLSLADLPLPHLVVAASAVLLSLLHVEDKHTSSSILVKAILLIALLAFALIAASYAPSALIEKNPPHPRTRVIARSTMLMAIVLMAWLGTQLAARHKYFAKIRFNITIVLAALTLIYIGRALYLSVELQPIYSSRARIWDERNEILLSSAELGLEYIEVQAIDGAPIGGLRDFKLATTHWINVCAARFYGVGEISGLP